MGPQEPGSLAGALAERAEQDVFGAEVAVPDPLGLVPAQIQDLMGVLGEPPEHLASFGTGGHRGILISARPARPPSP
jgi:hypothetical protein